MSKKKYVKPEVEIVVFNNKDDNMSFKPTYLTASNHSYKNMTYKSEIIF